MSHRTSLSENQGLMGVLLLLQREMALRQMLGWSEGDLMRSDAKPCSRLMRQTAAIFTVGGALGFWVFCRLHYGIKVSLLSYKLHISYLRHGDSWG